MARITFSLPDELEALVEDYVGEQKLPSVSSYVAGLIERDLASAGMLPGSGLKAVREEATAAAEIAGHDETLAALRAVKASALARRASAHVGA